MNTQKNKKNKLQKTRLWQDVLHSHGVSRIDVIKVLLITSIFIITLYLAFVIVRPTFDQVQGSLVGVAAIAWLVVFLSSVVSLLCGVLIFSYKKDRARKIKKVNEGLLAAAFITSGVILFWAILCAYLAAKHTLDMSPEFWMGILIPVGVASWLASCVVSLSGKKRTGIAGVLLAIFLGALVSAGAIFIMANVVFGLAFWFYAMI